MKKLIALALSIVMVACVFVSCNGSGGDETKITVKVTVQNNGTDMYAQQEITMTRTEDEIPTVFDAVCQALEFNEAEYETGTFTGYNIITSIDGISETDDMFWQVLVNGKEPEARYAALPIVEGDEILFFYGGNALDTDDTTEPETTEEETYETVDDGYEE